MCQIFRAQFEPAARVKLIQIYFSDQQASLYKLDVLVTVGGKLVSHQALGESAFARYVRYRRTGQSQKDSAEPRPGPDECLRLPLSCACSEMTVKLIYGYASTSLGTAGKDSSLPSTVAEFYGEAPPPEDAGAALASYSQRLVEYEKQPGAKLGALGQSVRMLSIPVPGRPNETTMVPFLPEKKAVSPAAKPEPKAPESATGPTSTRQIESDVLDLDEVQVQCRDGRPGPGAELRELQDQLRALLKARAGKP
jgi:hypothetical protein